MIRDLSPEILIHRAVFYRKIREFFEQRGFLEVETPLLNSTGNFEPFIDPFQIDRGGIEKSPSRNPLGERAYLITSPEYNLKTVLARLKRPIFQIAHAFRNGDVGPIHTQEFLMLEWYRPEFDANSLMLETGELIRALCDLDFVDPVTAKHLERIRTRTVGSLFEEYLGCGLERQELEEKLVETGLLGPGESASDFRYDELFFSLFLNRIENRLEGQSPVFVCDYPPELSANARVVDGVARRFELYIQGIELANGYDEIVDARTQLEVFESENQIRRSIGKPDMEVDPSFRSALERGLPPSSGIAVGLDRLFAVLLGERDLSFTSPFL